MLPVKLRLSPKGVLQELSHFPASRCLLSSLIWSWVSSSDSCQRGRRRTHGYKHSLHLHAAFGKHYRNSHIHTLTGADFTHWLICALRRLNTDKAYLCSWGVGRGFLGGGVEKHFRDGCFSAASSGSQACYRLPGSHLAHATWLALSPRFRKCIETKRETGREGAKEIKPQEGTNRFSSVSPSWLD